MPGTLLADTSVAGCGCAERGAGASLATSLDSKNVKAWYRLAKAREARREWSLCLEACEGGLGADKENKPLKKLAAKVSSDATKER